MKVARIVQFLILIVLAVYLLIVHNGNNANVRLPFLIAMPPAIALALALALGWLLGWFPGRVTLWRRERELRRLQRRLRELEEPRHPAIAYAESEPVIPDRTGSYPAPKESPDYENF